MSEYDRNSWEERWSQALREHGDGVAQRHPNAHLSAEVGDLRPGRALDRPPQHDDQRAQAPPVAATVRRTHDGDDFLDGSAG